eukprot:scaffold1300_cov317-Prasinococcus_capsulatus_cf.AAC.14
MCTAATLSRHSTWPPVRQPPPPCKRAAGLARRREAAHLVAVDLVLVGLGQAANEVADAERLLVVVHRLLEAPLPEGLVACERRGALSRWRPRWRRRRRTLAALHDLLVEGGAELLGVEAGEDAVAPLEVLEGRLVLRVGHEAQELVLHLLLLRGARRRRHPRSERRRKKARARTHTSERASEDDEGRRPLGGAHRDAAVVERGLGLLEHAEDEGVLGPLAEVARGVLAEGLHHLAQHARLQKGLPPPPPQQSNPNDQRRAPALNPISSDGHKLQQRQPAPRWRWRSRMERAPWACVRARVRVSAAHRDGLLRLEVGGEHRLLELERLHLALDARRLAHLHPCAANPPAARAVSSAGWPQRTCRRPRRGWGFAGLR